MKFISPKTDFAFKKIFGSIHSKNILISFLNAIVYNNQNIIQSLEIINPYNHGVTNTLKETYLDVKALLDNGSTVIIEMQILNVEDFKKRVIYNLAKAYGNQLDVGQGYMMLKPFIALTIADFVLFKKIDKMITKFRFKEETELLNYQDELTLMFVELPKFKKELSALETLSDKWIYFIKSAPNLEVIPESLEEVSEIEAALNIANIANLSNEELEELGQQEKLMRDKKGQISLARKEGEETGIGIDIVSNHEGVIGGTIGIGAGAGLDVNGGACCDFCGYFGSHQNFCGGNTLASYDQCDVGKLIQSNPIFGGPFIG